MAINAYLIVDGIPGPSTSKQNAIDILAFSFGASNSSVIGAGSSGGETRAGRAHVSDLSITKVLDKTSPLMFDHCVSGDLIKKVELSYDKPMGNQQEVYFKVLMTDVLVTSIQESGSSENPTESITFAFATVKVSYNPEKDGKLAGFVEKGWDVQKLKTI
jgi:type VI secretion system secreted protein Hcp